MRERPFGSSSPRKIHLLMSAALFGSVAIELILLIDHLIMPTEEGILSSFQIIAQLVSFCLLVLFLVLRHFHKAQSLGSTNISLHQTQALNSLLTNVKHQLNNDMQVVVGNAELAQILIKSGDDVQKPVSNISGAATAAIAHINQLSVFNATRDVTTTAVDLNALLRQCAARLIEDLPASATVRLELDRLPVKIVIDAHLFTLSLTQLIYGVARHFGTGYEVVLKTTHLLPGTKVGRGSVSADIRFIPQPGSNNVSGKVNAPAEELPMNVLFVDSAVLIDLSGAATVRHECSEQGAQINMLFNSDGVPEKIE